LFHQLLELFREQYPLPPQFLSTILVGVVLVVEQVHHVLCEHPLSKILERVVLVEELAHQVS
jgi:hypothetical protein